MRRPPGSDADRARRRIRNGAIAGRERRPSIANKQRGCWLVGHLAPRTCPLNERFAQKAVDTVLAGGALRAGLFGRPSMPGPGITEDAMAGRRLGGGGSEVTR